MLNVNILSVGRALDEFVSNMQIEQDFNFKQGIYRKNY